jgi:hypothetical protein
MKRSCVFVLVVLSAFWLGSLAVDRSKFIHCSQSGFCRRNRDLKEGQSQHTLSNVRVDSNGAAVRADLSNPSDPAKPLELEISKYVGDEVVRVRVFEKSPLRGRFEPKDVLSSRCNRASLATASDRNRAAPLSPFPATRASCCTTPH